MPHSEMPNDRLTEAEAQRVWRRSAEAQARDGGDGRRLLPRVSVDEPGLEVALVVEAARQAGIGGPHVQAAIATVRDERYLPEPPVGRDFARRFYGDLLDHVTVAATLRASPDAVFRAILDVCARPTHGLGLSERLADPLHGGTVVYEIQGLDAVRKQGMAAGVSGSAVRKLYFFLAPLEEGCEVRMYGPIAWSHSAGAAAGGLLSLLGGGGAGAATGFGTVALAGAALTGPLGLVVVGGAALVGGVLGGGLTRKGYRALAAHGIERAREAMRKLLLEIELEATRGA